jgi:hypothetical protein
MTDKYKIASENLAKALDIAIAVVQKFPPKEWEEHYVTENKNEIDFTIDLCNERKEMALNPKPQYCNMQSLKYLYEDIFTQFQEGNGVFVEEFWKEIKAQNLPYKRENKLAKILKRKKINNIHEFDFVTDVIVPYQQEGFINEEEVVLLNKWLGDFENRKKK